QLLLQRVFGAVALDGHAQLPVVAAGRGLALDRQRGKTAAFGCAEHARQHAFGTPEREIKLVAHWWFPSGPPWGRATMSRPVRRHPASRHRRGRASARCCGWAAPAARRW